MNNENETSSQGNSPLWLFLLAVTAVLIGLFLLDQLTGHLAEAQNAKAAIIQSNNDRAIAQADADAQIKIAMMQADAQKWQMWLAVIANQTTQWNPIMQWSLLAVWAIVFLMVAARFLPRQVVYISRAEGYQTDVEVDGE